VIRQRPDNEPPELRRPLTESEAIAFREDLRAADQEVQSYFRIYYIVGLIGVAAWLISPQSKPLIELMLGNGGYNVYVPIAIAFLNSVSVTYVLYKSIEIHEIAQFIAYASTDDSAFVGWEEWRRGPTSATRWPRRLYTPALTLVPVAVSIGLIYASCRIVNTSVADLVSAASQAAPKVVGAAERSTQGPLPTTGAPEDSTQVPLPSPVVFSKEQIESISAVYSKAKVWLWIVIALHAIPGILVYFNLRKVPKLWSRIWPKRTLISE
jgi:hypothetical protein